MKKVLFAASVYYHLSAFHKPFMKLLQLQGFEVHAIGSNSLGRKDELLRMGIICHDIEFNRLPFSRKNMKAIKELETLFINTFFDLIHVHTPTVAFLTRYAASKHNQGKLLYTAHGFHFFKGASYKNWLFFYPAEKLATKWTDGLIVMNQEDFDLGKRLGYIEEKNLFNVHGVGVDLTEFRENFNETRQSLLMELGLNSNSLIVSCIAELSGRKNQMFLLENWKSITILFPNTHLILVGDGPDYELINKLITEKNLPNIHLLGYRNDVPNIISGSDIVTLVSKHEGLPRCLMEAMACGKPIITTNVRGSRDLVEHESTGLIVELDDNTKLVEAFSRLLLSEEIRHSYGIEGQRKIQEYSLENVLEEMDHIYSNYS